MGLDIWLVLGLQSVTRRMLAMAGDNCDGWRGMVRIKGVVGVVLAVSRVWMKDESPDLAPTMKELDRRLQQAEEWAISLQLFQHSQGRRSQAATENEKNAGRHGSNND